MASLMKYKYYDTPEGQDIYKKVFVTSKYATVTGLGTAYFDVLLLSHPKGILSTIGVVGGYVGPLVGMATAFTVTANGLQQFRGKNDMLNYFVGGAVAGSVFGAWKQSITLAVPAGIVLGIAACVKKAAIDEGWTIIPDTFTATKTIQSVRHDWTMAKDIESLKGWTTGQKQ